MPVAAGNNAIEPGLCNQILLSFQDLELRKQDNGNRFWVADATESTAVHVTKHPAGSQASASVKRLSQWLDTSSELLQQLQERVRIVAA